MEEYPTNQREFNLWFRSERSCLDYLGRVRWPGGFVCPRCGSIKAWIMGRGLRRCRRCGHQASLTSGTIFHGTRKPMRKWFRAIWHLTDPDHRVSVVALQEALGLGSYRIAWAWVRKLRHAMAAAGSPLSDLARKGGVSGSGAFGGGKSRPKGSRRKGARAPSGRRKPVDRGLLFCRLVEQAVVAGPVPTESLTPAPGERR